MKEINHQATFSLKGNNETSLSTIPQEMMAANIRTIKQLKQYVIENNDMKIKYTKDAHISEYWSKFKQDVYVYIERMNKKINKKPVREVTYTYTNTGYPQKQILDSQESIINYLNKQRPEVGSKVKEISDISQNTLLKSHRIREEKYKYQEEYIRKSTYYISTYTSESTKKLRKTPEYIPHPLQFIVIQGKRWLKYTKQKDRIESSTNTKITGSLNIYSPESLLPLTTPHLRGDTIGKYYIGGGASGRYILVNLETLSYREYSLKSGDTSNTLECSELYRGSQGVCCKENGEMYIYSILTQELSPYYSFTGGITTCRGVGGGRVAFGDGRRVYVYTGGDSTDILESSPAPTAPQGQIGYIGGGVIVTAQGNYLLLFDYIRMYTLLFQYPTPQDYTIIYSSIIHILYPQNSHSFAAGGRDASFGDGVIQIWHILGQNTPQYDHSFYTQQDCSISTLKEIGGGGSGAYLVFGACTKICSLDYLDRTSHPQCWERPFSTDLVFDIFISGFGY